MCFRMTHEGVNGDNFHWHAFVAPCKHFTTFISKIWEVKATQSGLGLAVYMIMLQQNNWQTILVTFCLQIFLLPFSFNGLWLDYSTVSHAYLLNKNINIFQRNNYIKIH